MPRPRKCRMVCRLPGASEFVPLDGRKDASPIVLTVDEFEALRLIDGEDYSQEQCGEQMHIARATVQQIVDSARKKISFALVEGRPLKILGGEYRLCEGGAARCGCCRAGCGRCLRNRKEGFAMRIAVAANGNEVAGHFGHCENFWLYDVENQAIVKEESIPNPGHRPGFLPNFWETTAQNVVIAGHGRKCGGYFAHRNIETILGASGDAHGGGKLICAGELHSDASACHKHEHARTSVTTKNKEAGQHGKNGSARFAAMCMKGRLRRDFTCPICKAPADVLKKS